VTKLAAVALGALMLVACYGPDPNLTDEGLSKPELALEFPEETTAGSTKTAELRILNPGPGDMDSLVVAFSRLGDPELPLPIVDVAPGKEEGAVRDVEPAPTAVSPDGVIYTFDGLDEGRELVIRFTLRIPVVTGPAGNAILVYEGSDPDRAKGVRLETEVGG
jgi:hypothetical protein